MLEKLTIQNLFDEAKALSQCDEPPRLRNAGRSICDAFKLFLAELGGRVYGFSFIASLSMKIRFQFLSQSLPELGKYQNLVERLDKLRNKTEHSDSFFPSKEEISTLVEEVEPLIESAQCLAEKLQSKRVLLDLEAQRRLLSLFLSWLDRDLREVQSSWKSFFRNEMPETDTVKRVRELISLGDKVWGMDLDAINDHLESARALIYELDEQSTNLSTMMEEEAAMMR